MRFQQNVYLRKSYHYFIYIVSLHRHILHCIETTTMKVGNVTTILSWLAVKKVINSSFHEIGYQMNLKSAKTIDHPLYSDYSNCFPIVYYSLFKWEVMSLNSF